MAATKNINAEKIQGSLTITSVSADTISATTFSAATINSGSTNLYQIFRSGADVFVSGGTYDNLTGIATFRNSTGGTFTVTGFSTGGGSSFSGGTVTGSTVFSAGMTANTIYSGATNVGDLIANAIAEAINNSMLYSFVLMGV